MRWFGLFGVLLLVGCGGGARLAAVPVWTTHEPAGFATLTVEDADAAVHQTLAVTSLDVEVEVRGRLAVTRVTQVFQNTQSRAVEGTFEMTLPPGGEAHVVLTELVELEPRRGLAHLELGRALLERGESEVACQALRNAVWLEPSLHPAASELAGEDCELE